jgi:hypothetical protein
MNFDLIMFRKDRIKIKILNNKFIAKTVIDMSRVDNNKRIFNMKVVNSSSNNLDRRITK